MICVRTLHPCIYELELTGTEAAVEASCGASVRLTMRTFLTIILPLQIVV